MNCTDRAGRLRHLLMMGQGIASLQELAHGRLNGMRVTFGFPT